MSQTTVRENRENAGPMRGEGAELQWLGDPKHKSLLNAENLTVTRGGRLFVTGSERVCEITADGTGGYVWTDIPLPDDLPRAMFRNGIASDDRYLYLACAEVDQNAQPLLTGWLPQLTKRPQDALGFTLLLLAETLCPVRSYVLRADLRASLLHWVLAPFHWHAAIVVGRGHTPSTLDQRGPIFDHPASHKTSHPSAR
jgi:hypothetical protein